MLLKSVFFLLLCIFCIAVSEASKKSWSNELTHLTTGIVKTNPSLIRRNMNLVGNGKIPMGFVPYSDYAISLDIGTPRKSIFC